MADLKNRKHLFFDLDDTLWDFEKNSSAILKELFVELALAEKLNTNFENFYQAYKKINQVLWSQYYKKTIDKAFLRNNRFNLAFREFKYDNAGESLVMNEQYLLRAPHGRLLKEGCIETLDYLSEKYTLHLITNGFEETQHIKIDGCGLRDYFSQIIVSESHQLNKPDEKIFRLAESLAGAKPTECVMIGDNFECDIEGAVNAGWESVYFSEEAHQHPVKSVSRLPDLKEFF